jgi:hypothetical protein
MIQYAQFLLKFPALVVLGVAIALPTRSQTADAPHASAELKMPATTSTAAMRWLSKMTSLF